VLLALNAYVYNFMARVREAGARELRSFPLQIDDWRCGRNEPLDPKVKVNLGATDTLICTYVNRAHRTDIGVYVGYHATQIREEGGGDFENSIHPPAHCLPGSGWDIVDSRTVPLDFPGITDSTARAKRLVIAKGDDRQLVYYWYQMQGRHVAEDWQKILYVGYERAHSGRTDGALVRFTMPLTRHDDATVDPEQELLAFAERIAPMLPAYVPN
jgi:EpsI family protein